MAIAGKERRLKEDYVLAVAARFPCNGNNGGKTRRPCTQRMKLKCPWLYG